MHLQMPAHLASPYKNKAQQARVVTEAWGRSQLFCANCDSDSIAATPCNNRAIDFICPKCSAPFQLKAKSGLIGSTVGDGAFSAMLASIREDRTPNLLIMRYQWPDWRIRDLILIPYFAFPESAVVKRNPLAPSARRAGWVGCNIDLRRIAPDARIPVVTNGVPRTAAIVRDNYARLKPLKQIKAPDRGWTLDVLNAIRRLGLKEFSTTDAYACESELGQLHPDNRHLRDKIRQQLQVLRDAGLLIHVQRGRWRIP